MLNNLLIKALYLSVSLGFTACSILPDFMSLEPSEVETITDKTGVISSQPPLIISQQDATMGRHIQEWQSMKPSIQRLVAIEGELKELILQLNQLTKETKVETNIKVPVAEQSSYSRIETSEPKVLGSDSPRSLKNRGTAVQLASLKDKGGIKTTWNQLLVRYSKAFDALTPIYEETLVGGEKYFRLKATGISSKGAAIQLCKELAVDQTPCFLTSNVGDLLF
jgi:hypothetical protein